MSVHQLARPTGCTSADQLARSVGHLMSFDDWASCLQQYRRLWSKLVYHSVLQSFIHLKAIVIAMFYRP